MAKPIQDPDLPTDDLPLIAAVLPLKGSYYTIVSRDGSVFRLHRDRVEFILMDGGGRITEIQLTEGET